MPWMLWPWPFSTWARAAGRRTRATGLGLRSVGGAAVRGRGCGPRRREKARKLTCSDAVVKPRKPSLTHNSDDSGRAQPWTETAQAVEANRFATCSTCRKASTHRSLTALEPNWLDLKYLEYVKFRARGIGHDLVHQPILERTDHPLSSLLSTTRNELRAGSCCSTTIVVPPTTPPIAGCGRRGRRVVRNLCLTRGV